jgi:hypothetical protein
LSTRSFDPLGVTVPLQFSESIMLLFVFFASCFFGEQDEIPPTGIKG